MITELPLPFTGRVFCSPMPFSKFDTDLSIWDEYLRHKVQAVVLLVDDEYCLQQAARNLRQLYTENGLQVLHLPIPDGGLPDMGQLESTVNRAIAQAREGMNIAIHCWAGKGRTGMFAACLAKRALELEGQAAIHWIRGQVRGAVETRRQEQMVADF